MSHEPLEDYFRHINAERINEPTGKETEMSLFEKLNSFIHDRFRFLDDKTEIKPDFTTLYIPPKEIEASVPSEDQDYWTFQMYTGPWYSSDTCEDKPEKFTSITEAADGTWMEALDKILDALSYHYGYNIKEKVYYSVDLPLNIEGEAGYGHQLNEDVFQQLLLSHPEVYDRPSVEEFWKGLRK